MTSKCGGVALRAARTALTRRMFSSSPASHEFLEANSFVGSWEAPKDPREAEARLARLRREYKKQVKEVRKEYISEMEVMRIEKQRKDDARKEALRLANEERKKAKAEAAKIRAQKLKIAQDEFRQTLMKERAEKLEYWRMKESTREEKKKEQKELLRRQSSLWIAEHELEGKILAAVRDSTPL